MNRHVHADKIIAKAENMDLVVLSRFKGFDWIESNVDAWNSFSFLSEYEYFLCLEEHKEACLHWLNGGDIEHDDCKQGWITMENINYPMDPCEPLWSPSMRLMTKEQNFRIKPKKEKRWIGVYGNHVTDGMYPTKELCERCVSRSAKFKYCASEGWQFIEIEVEV